MCHLLLTSSGNKFLNKTFRSIKQCCSHLAYILMVALATRENAGTNQRTIRVLKVWMTAKSKNTEGSTIPTLIISPRPAKLVFETPASIRAHVVLAIHLAAQESYDLLRSRFSPFIAQLNCLSRAISKVCCFTEPDKRGTRVTVTG